MPCWFRDRAGAAGFSVLEVLVAFAIVGLTLVATASVFSTALSGHTAASDVDTALALAEAKLDAAGADEMLRPMSTQGVFADRFRWRVAVTRYDDKAAAAAELSVPAFRLFRVETTIVWQQGRRERQVSLATLRLAPTPP